MFSALTLGRMTRLLAAARYIVRDEERAQDVVQDALLQAWLDLRALRDPDHFDAWLHRVLVRACYRAQRRRRARDVVEIPMAGGPEPTARDDHIGLALRDQLERRFARLSMDQRVVIVVHYYLGLTVTEAAEVIGVPVGTVQSRLNRATRGMRAAIEAGERTPGLRSEATR